MPPFFSVTHTEVFALKPFHWINDASPEKRVRAMKSIFINQIIQTIAFAVCIGIAGTTIKNLSDENDMLVEELAEARHG
jgi:Na+/H+-dicarboxylate symporter